MNYLKKEWLIVCMKTSVERSLFFMEKHKKSTKILFTTLITFLCGMLVYTGGRYVYAQNRSDSDNLSITVVGKGSVEYTIDDIDYEVTEGATVYQTVPAEKEVKIQVKPEENNTIDTISCNGDDVENVSDQNAWEETVKFDKDTVKDYKIIFKEAAKSADTQSQDASEDEGASENAVVAKEDEGTVENENSSLEATQESSEQASENAVEENSTKDIRLKDLNIDFNVTDISEETKLIIKAYQSGVYDDKTQIEARKKKAEETKLDKYCDDDYFLTDAYYKKYSEKMLMYDNCVILSRNSTKNVIKENEKEADKYAAKYDKAIQSSSEESSNKIQESLISRLFKTKSVSAANLSVIDHSYHQAWQGGGYISNGIWRLSNNHLSFCADGLGAEPSNGSSGPDNIVNSSNLRKALYYGYGGPGDCLTRRLGTSASIAWTDDLVSMAYTGHSVGSVAVGGYHWRIAGQSYWNEIMSKPDPIQYGYVAHVVSINGGGYNWQGVWKAKQPLAYGVYNPKGKLKVKKSSANTSFVSGKSGYTLAGAVYSIYSDSGCTKKVGSVSTDANGNSNTIELNNGTYYVKETIPPAGYNLDTNVKPVTIAIGQTSSVSSSEQPGGAIRIIKKSDNEKLTSGNSGYSLNGAKYGVYADSGCTKLVQTITTGPNGVSGYFGVAGASKYYIKELKASDGYQLNPKVYTATVNGLVSVDVNVTETPQILKKPLLIHKTDTKNNALADAQFEVKFYKGIVTNDSSKLSGTPLTWHLKSDSNGDIYLDSSHLVSGKANSSFLTDSTGSPILTIGTVTVKETQTPSKDYVLDENTYLIQISSEANASTLTYSGSKTVIDKSSWPTKVRFVKFSGYGSIGIFGGHFYGQDGELINGTKFLHTLPNGQTETLTYQQHENDDPSAYLGCYSDDFVEIKNLPVGIHQLKEIAPTNTNLYELNTSTIKFEVKKDGSIRPIRSSTSDEDYFEYINPSYPDYLELGINNSFPSFDWEITKTNGENQPIANVEYELYGRFCLYPTGMGQTAGTTDLDGVIKDLGTYKTDSNGKIVIKNLKRQHGNDYYLVEKSTLKDYQPPEKDEYDYFEYEGKKIYYDARINTTTRLDDKKNLHTYVWYSSQKPSESISFQNSDDETTNKNKCNENVSYSGDFAHNFTLKTKLLNIQNNPTKFKLKKLDSTGSELQNVTFILYGKERIYQNPNFYTYDEDKYEYNYYQKEYTSDENGEISFDLKDGDYYLYEITENKGYEIPQVKTTNINGKEIKYNIHIEKQHSTDGTERIYIYKVEKDLNGDAKESSVFIEDKQNYINTAYSTIENGNKTIHFAYINQKGTADLKIIKKDSNNKFLKNIEFTIYSDADCTKAIAKATTDKNGEALFKNFLK